MLGLINKLKNFIDRSTKIVPLEGHELCSKCEGLGLSDYLTECTLCSGTGVLKITPNS